jgi:hypothetical protein
VILLSDRATRLAVRLRVRLIEVTKGLSERTVARFFHIDEKLDAAADIALAANIPLIH